MKPVAPLTRGENRCLRWITRCDFTGKGVAITEDELAFHLGYKRPYVSALVNSLADKGYMTIERRRHPGSSFRHNFYRVSLWNPHVRRGICDLRREFKRVREPSDCGSENRSSDAKRTATASKGSDPVGRPLTPRCTQLKDQRSGRARNFGETKGNDVTSWRIIEGDCREVLASLPERSLHTCVTSPPFYGLRDYGVDGQLGLEGTPDEFVAVLVDVFREVRRVLRDDGTVWLNLGDSYTAGAGSRNGMDNSGLKRNVQDEAERQRCLAENKVYRAQPVAGVSTGVKPKDLLGIPWLVAFALRADGWYLRSDIIWSKTNPMPESVTDRPTKAHEYVFLLSKGPRYFYDADAIREDAAPATLADKRMGTERVADFDTAAANFGEGTSASRRCARNAVGDPTSGRNKRSVWTVATQPYAGAHFATFPPKLIEPCILAGAPERACGECGAPWVRSEGERTLDLSRPQARRARELAEAAGLTPEHIAAIRACGVGDVGKAQVTQNGYGHNDDAVQALADEAKVALGGYYREFLLARPTGGGLEPSCSHYELVPPVSSSVTQGAKQPGAEWRATGGQHTTSGVVLDPFAGSGTTGMVALRHGRSFVGIELSPAYAAMARWRIRDDSPLLNSVAEAAA